MAVEEELSFAQRAHLAQRVIRTLVANTTVLIVLGILLFAIVVVVGVPLASFMHSFGYFENRLNSVDGALCDPLDYKDPEGNPAQIVVIRESGAEKAGLKDGDVITRINTLQADEAIDILRWAENFPDVKPGDFVQVDVNRYGTELSFEVQTTPTLDDPSKPLLGIFISETATCYQYFLLNEDTKFTESDLSIVLIGLWGVIAVVCFIGFILVYYFFTWRPSAKELGEDMNDLENDYLEESYVLTFTTKKPEGTKDGEKIFNLAQDVFPELREQDGSKNKWKGKMKLEDGYEFDCFQTTSDEEPQLFIVKHFGSEEITMDEIQELCHKVENLGEDEKVKKKIKDVDVMDISRIICVGKNYNPKFFKSDKKLESMMEELEFDGKIDLMLDSDGKYKVIWIDYE